MLAADASGRVSIRGCFGTGLPRSLVSESESDGQCSGDRVLGSSVSGGGGDSVEESDGQCSGDRVLGSSVSGGGGHSVEEFSVSLLDLIINFNVYFMYV